MSDKDDGTLTPEQVLHWRQVLSGMIGSVAYTLPETHIQLYRDQVQERINRLAGEKK